MIIGILIGYLFIHQQLDYNSCKKEEFKPEVCAFEKKLSELEKK